MEDKIVTLETYYDPMLAEIIRTRLEANGIPCFVADGNMVGAYPLYSQLLGGVKLKVFERDVARCLEILAQQEELLTEEEPLDDDSTTCPYCTSTNVRYGVATEIKADWFTGFLSLILTAIPFWVANRSWHCFNCHRDFE